MSARSPHNAATLRAAILDLLARRDAGKSICPSEAARALAGTDEKQWRQMMKPLRSVAVEMARSGEIEIRRKGKTVNPEDFRGVYRLALPASPPDPASGDEQA